LVNGASAEAAFGSVTSIGCNPTSLFQPQTMYVGSDGVCYVADTFHSRVLRLTACATATTGKAFDGVFGQTNKTTCFNQTDPLFSNFTMFLPRGVVGDGSGSLWVADSGNGLLKKYTGAATAVDGVSPAVILGDFMGVSGAGCTDQLMTAPRQLTYDTVTNTLWAADLVCNRIAAYQNANTKTNNDTIDYVLGQLSRFTALPTCLAQGLAGPWGVYFDSGTNSLFVGDSVNQRVLVYSNARSLTTGSSATFLIGQNSFSDCFDPTVPLDVRVIPNGLYYDSTVNLLVTSPLENRVPHYKCVTTQSPSNTPFFPIPSILVSLFGPLFTPSSNAGQSSSKTHSKAAGGVSATQTKGASPSQTGTSTPQTKQTTSTGVTATSSPQSAHNSHSSTKANLLVCQALCQRAFYVCKKSSGNNARLCRLGKKNCVKLCH